MKTCRICKKSKSLDNFYKHTYRDSYQSYCIDCQKIYSKERFEITKEQVKNSHLKRTYGFTLEAFNLLKEKQHGCCAICGNKEDLCVDHDHETKEIRGLLCRGCNTGCGHFKDDILLLSKAIDYLRSFK